MTLQLQGEWACFAQIFQVILGEHGEVGFHLGLIAPAEELHTLVTKDFWVKGREALYNEILRLHARGQLSTYGWEGPNEFL